MQAVKDQLHMAADLLERDGWCRNYRWRRGRRCITAALQDAAVVLGTKQRAPYADELVTTYLLRHGVEPPQASLRLWNDRVARSRHEVVRVLCGTAEELPSTLYLWRDSSQSVDSGEQ